MDARLILAGMTTRGELDVCQRPVGMMKEEDGFSIENVENDKREG